MSSLLLCENQTEFASAIKEFLQAEHFSVEIESSGLRAIECLRRKSYDLLILASGVQGLDGLDVLRNYRIAGGNIPVLMISSRTNMEDKPLVLDAGADAYMVKPFQLAELAAQIRALLRRPVLRTDRILSYGPIAIDADAGTVMKDDKPIHLYPMEFKLLHFLMSHPNQVFGAHAIFERVWQKGFGHADDTVRTHIRTLRRKIDSVGSPSIITTVRGLGYKVNIS
ncbi:MAG: response regulator transcription factor [Candidatus Obscuribacterales bacterium]|nr:response regulator transcription factor [Candidatus Obscuribacterales bacterium]